MIARFDHRPMLTAALALSTIVLVAVVVTLAALLITEAPPAATSQSESGGNPGAVVMGTSENYGEKWNNYGHDFDQPKPAQTRDDSGNVQSGLGPGSPARDARGSYSSNGNDPIERHAGVVAAYQDNR